MKKIFFLTPVFLLTLAFVWGQNAANGNAQAAIETDNTAAGQLPRTYRKISLGMGLDDLKKALAADMIFAYRGDRDVSFLPAEKENLVETAGTTFLRRSFFQLRNDKVYIMAFTLDTTLIDHYSVFTTLVKKYGEPKSLNPMESVWEDENTRISLERPLTIKYIDKKQLAEIIDESKAGESYQLMSKQEFLEGF